MIKLPALLIAGLALSGAASAAEPMRMGAAASPSDRAYAAAGDAMMAGMDVKPSGDADRDFAAMMVPHHQGAVAMAKVEIQYGRDPVMRKLAADVIAAQEREITLMQSWQKAHAR